MLPTDYVSVVLLGLRQVPFSWFLVFLGLRLVCPSGWIMATWFVLFFFLSSSLFHPLRCNWDQRTNLRWLEDLIEVTLSCAFLLACCADLLGCGCFPQHPVLLTQVCPRLDLPFLPSSWLLDPPPLVGPGALAMTVCTWKNRHITFILHSLFTLIDGFCIVGMLSGRVQR